MSRKSIIVAITLLLFCKGNDISSSNVTFCDFQVILTVVNGRADSVKVILHQKKKHWGFITGDNTTTSELASSKWFDTLYISANDSFPDTITAHREMEDPQIGTCSFDCDGPKDLYGWNELVINSYTTDGATQLGIDTFAICTEWEDPKCEEWGTRYQSVDLP